MYLEVGEMGRDIWGKNWARERRSKDIPAEASPLSSASQSLSVSSTECASASEARADASAAAAADSAADAAAAARDSAVANSIRHSSSWSVAS